MANDTALCEHPCWLNREGHAQVPFEARSTAGSERQMTRVSLYLMTDKVIVRVTKEIVFTRVPCVGEWIRFESSGLLPHQVTEVTHDECGDAEVVLGAQLDSQGRTMFHPTDADLREDIQELVANGWAKQSERANRHHGNAE